MEVLRGIPVSSGVAISTAYVLGRHEFAIPSRSIAPEKADEEISRLQGAIVAAAAEIEGLKGRLSGTPAMRYSAILDAHLLMLTDEKLAEEIAGRIRNDGYNAEHAVTSVLAGYTRTLEAVEDEYLRERAGDIRDIQRRLLGALTGTKPHVTAEFPHPVAIIAHDLTPSETLSLDREKVTGIATDAGGSTSHTAIVAKALSIPAVVALGRATSEVAGGDFVIIDGNMGLVFVNPDEATLERYRSLASERRVAGERLEALRDLPAVTTDGHVVRLMGNIELPEEIAVALSNGAEGIGLFRTEFLFLRAGHEPSEEEQFSVYAEAARKLGDKPLSIRTFDLGGDKATGEIEHPEDRNPSLGCRSIRYCLENPDIFRKQLRAILRASVHGNIRLLFPMISCVEEVRRAKALVEEVRRDLSEKGIPYSKDIQVGIMVEVPSVAITPDAYTGEVDFFSIGTNDLIQYTMAAERVNEHVAWLFTPSHPAILRLVRNVVDTAKAAKMPVSVCGEMSRDPLFTMFLVGLGIDELSLAPQAIPGIKQLIRAFSFENARDIARKTLTLNSARDVAALLLEALPESHKPA